MYELITAFIVYIYLFLQEVLLKFNFAEILIIIIICVVLRHIEWQFDMFCLERNQEITNHNLKLNTSDPSLYYVPVVQTCVNNSFLSACKDGNTKLIKDLLKSGVNILQKNDYGESAMYLATYFMINNPKQKDATCLWILYHAGCPINDRNNQGFTPLHLAAYYGHCSLIQWLISKGADCQVEPSPAQLASMNDHKAAVSLLSQKHKLNSRSG